MAADSGARLGCLSIAAPAYNEAQGLAAVVESWLAYLSRQPDLERFEIVVCDDGSVDGTGAVLERLAAAHPEVKPVRHPANQGAAAALATAIRATTLDWVLLLDADGQFPIENLDAFRRALARRPADAYIGARARKQGGLVSRFGSLASGWLCNLFHGTRYADFNCALKLVRGGLLRSLALEARGLNYSTDVTAKLVEAGAPPVEVPVLHAPRGHGRSSVRPKDALDRLLFVLYLGARRCLVRRAVLRAGSHGR